MPGRDARELGAIFVGGALGTLVRASLAEAFPTSSQHWPWPTFAVNIVGAFLLGYVTTRLQERLPLSSYRRPLLGTGLCGGLTTFSTMQVETLRMLDTGAWLLAAEYCRSECGRGIRRDPSGDRHRTSSPGSKLMTVLVWVCVVLAGGAGSVVRFVVDGSVGRRLGSRFPFGTFVVNISGALLLGLVAGLILSRDEALLAGTAVVGSYTTFSTWMLETQRAAEERQSTTAIINIVASVIFGVAAAALGRWIGEQL